MRNYGIWSVMHGLFHIVDKNDRDGIKLVFNIEGSKEMINTCSQSKIKYYKIH